MFFCFQEETNLTQVLNNPMCKHKVCNFKNSFKNKKGVGIPTPFLLDIKGINQRTKHRIEVRKLC